MIFAILTAALQSQANAIVPIFHEQLAEAQAAGADVTKHTAALQSFTDSLTNLGGVFMTPPVKPAS